jgi:hypothetical protein
LISMARAAILHCLILTIKPFRKSRKAKIKEPSPWIFDFTGDGSFIFYSRRLKQSAFFHFQISFKQFRRERIGRYIQRQPA